MAALLVIVNYAKFRTLYGRNKIHEESTEPDPSSGKNRGEKMVYTIRRMLKRTFVDGRLAIAAIIETTVMLLAANQLNASAFLFPVMH